MQLLDTFQAILLVLEEILYIIQGLVVVIFIHLVFTLAMARNTQVLAKATHTPLKEKRSSRLTRLRQRLRPRVELPPSDKKELVE